MEKAACPVSYAMDGAGRVSLTQRVRSALRRAIWQSVGLPHLVLLAIAQLEDDRQIEGDMYPK